jgi:hypothetical protein
MGALIVPSEGSWRKRMGRVERSEANGRTAPAPLSLAAGDRTEISAWPQAATIINCKNHYRLLDLQQICS